MAKFTFRLQSFLNIKEKLEEQRKTEYGEAISKLEDAKNTLNQIFAKKQNTILSMQNNINNAIHPNQLKNFNDYLAFLDKEVIRQEQVIEEKKQDVEKARLVLIEAMKERKKIENLKEKEKEEYLKEEFKEEQKIIDEIVSYKYNIKS